jgi:hypothetical protein
MYTDTDYIEAIKFALNYPPERDIPISYSYDDDKEIFKIVVFDGGWIHFKLNHKYVKSCLEWEGIKRWIQ